MTKSVFVINALYSTTMAVLAFYVAYRTMAYKKPLIWQSATFEILQMPAKRVWAGVSLLASGLVLSSLPYIFRYVVPLFR